MTIKTRNGSLLIFSFIAIASFLIHGGLFVWASFNDTIFQPQSPIRIYEFNLGGIFSYSFTSSIVAILVLAFLAPLLSLAVVRGFEKTQSLEIVLFIGILASLLMESVRIYIPYYGLWKSYSKSLAYIGKIIIGARLLFPLSLFFAQLFHAQEHNQNAERNLALLFVLTSLIAFFYPVNSGIITTSNTVLWGLRKFFITARVLIMMTTFVSMLIEGYNTGIKANYTKALGALAFFFGHLILSSADSVFTLAAGLIVFLAGCMIYLKSIHYIRNTWN